MLLLLHRRSYFFPLLLYIVLKLQEITRVMTIVADNGRLWGYRTVYLLELVKGIPNGTEGLG